MDKAVEQVERIFDNPFSSHPILKRQRIRGGGRLFGAAAAIKPALAAITAPKSIRLYVP